MAAGASVHSVMLDCRDLEGEVAFWGEILGLSETMRFPGYVWLGRLGSGGPRLGFQRVPEAKTVKNRMHLDLAVPDPEAFKARVVELGGSRLADHKEGRVRWTVMADPEGNEFCVTKKG
jgi:predicted enzyme related to lactoylglutathione lyase